MSTSIIGLLGLLLGLLISEYFRRTKRIETYSQGIFQKRLDIYEALFYKLNKAREISFDVIENSEYSKEDRHKIWSSIVMEIAEFTDKHALYLNEELTVHCMMTIMGVDDIYELEDPSEKEDAIKEFRDNYKSLLLMIKKESGLEKLDNLFTSITKVKHQSEFINYYKKTKERYEKESH